MASHDEFMGAMKLQATAREIKREDVLMTNPLRRPVYSVESTPVATPTPTQALPPTHLTVCMSRDARVGVGVDVDVGDMCLEENECRIVLSSHGYKHTIANATRCIYCILLFIFRIGTERARNRREGKRFW